MTRLAAVVVLLALALAAACAPEATVERTFAVVHTAPHHGALEVERNVNPIIAFSAPVAESSLESITLRQRDGDAFDEVDVTRFLDDDGLSVVLVPRRALAPETEHALEVTPDLLAVDGAELGAAYHSGFFTAGED